MPSPEEQEIARWYVMERPIERPNTNLAKAAVCVLVFIACTLAAAFTARFLFIRLGVLRHMPEWLQKLKEGKPGLFGFLNFLIVFFIAGLICLRMALIGVIRLYQHYAPEHVRRKCLFKPTCSEYAILALKKYGVIVGLVKTYKRLFIKCCGTYYSIDYP